MTAIKEIDDSYINDDYKKPSLFFLLRVCLKKLIDRQQLEDVVFIYVEMFEKKLINFLSM